MNSLGGLRRKNTHQPAMTHSNAVLRYSVRTCRSRRRSTPQPLTHYPQLAWFCELAWQSATPYWLVSSVATRCARFLEARSVRGPMMAVESWRPVDLSGMWTTWTCIALLSSRKSTLLVWRRWRTTATPSIYRCRQHHTSSGYVILRAQEQSVTVCGRTGSHLAVSWKDEVLDNESVHVLYDYTRLYTILYS